MDYTLDCWDLERNVVFTKHFETLLEAKDFARKCHYGHKIKVVGCGARTNEEMDELQRAIDGRK